jgi:1,4-dihydroxy-2-naphthoate octaprenyltransferase
MGDRATGRMTIAARTSPRGNKIFIASAFMLVWGFTAFAFAARYIPAWYALALAPVWALQVAQLWLGLHREQWLMARLLGFRVLRVGIVALTLLNFGFPT